MRNKWYIAVMICAVALHAEAFTPEPPLANATQESIAQETFHALRCVVCEGQSLAESDAALARQMRSEIRRMAQDGQSEHEILAFFQQRYGDTILMSPPLAPRTYMLWAAPLLLLAMGGIFLWRRNRS